jgi:hypothetical protein
MSSARRIDAALAICCTIERRVRWPSVAVLALRCVRQQSANPTFVLADGGTAEFGAPCRMALEDDPKFSVVNLGEITVETLPSNPPGGPLCVALHFQGLISCPYRVIAIRLGRSILLRYVERFLRPQHRVRGRLRPPGASMHHAPVGRLRLSCRICGRGQRHSRQGRGIALTLTVTLRRRERPMRARCGPRQVARRAHRHGKTRSTRESPLRRIGALSTGKGPG